MQLLIRKEADGVANLDLHLIARLGQVKRTFGLQDEYDRVDVAWVCMSMLLSRSERPLTIVSDVIMESGPLCG
jgi:hypothetical protein